MKKIKITTGLLLLVSMGAFAQHGSQYSIPEAGRKANYYENKAMDFLKEGRFAEAVLYSAIALNSDPKKEQIKGAHKGITEGFAKAFESIERKVNTAKPQAEKFDQEDPDPVMQARFNILDNYRMAQRIMGEMQKVAPELLKSRSKKTEDISFTFKDYSKAVTNADQAYADGKPIAAELKYKMAEKVFTDKNLESGKKAARLYRSIDFYVPAYKDSKEKYAKARELGTTNVAIAPFADLFDINKYGSLGASITERVTSWMVNDGKYQHEFMKVITNDKLNALLQAQKISIDQVTAEGASIKGIQALVTGQISRIENSVSVDKPYISEKEEEITVGTEKYVDSDGKTKERSIKQKVKGTYTSCAKSTLVTVYGSLTIVDAQNHSILSTKSFQAYGKETVTWARFTGDERVLSKSEKSEIRDEPPYPPMNTPLSSAVSEFVAHVMQEINLFATKVGD